MTKNESVLMLGQIKRKIQYGDYTTLGAILDCTPDAAKKRFFRGNEEAKKALLEIIETRERMIQDFQNKKLAI